MPTKDCHFTAKLLFLCVCKNIHQTFETWMLDVVHVYNFFGATGSAFLDLAVAVFVIAKTKTISHLICQSRHSA